MLCFPSTVRFPWFVSVLSGLLMHLWSLAPGQSSWAVNTADAFIPCSPDGEPGRGSLRLHPNQWIGPHQQAQYPILDPENCPILRANPCPKVTNRFCRLPLSTLFYLTRGF